MYYNDRKKRLAIKITDPSILNDKNSAHRRDYVWNECNVCTIGTFMKHAVIHFSETIPSNSIYLHYIGVSIAAVIL